MLLRKLANPHMTRKTGTKRSISGTNNMLQKKGLSLSACFFLLCIQRSLFTSFYYLLLFLSHLLGTWAVNVSTQLISVNTPMRQTPPHLVQELTTHADREKRKCTKNLFEPKIWQDVNVRKSNYTMLFPSSNSSMQMWLSPFFHGKCTTN